MPSRRRLVVGQLLRLIAVVPLLLVGYLLYALVVVVASLVVGIVLIVAIVVVMSVFGLEQLPSGWRLAVAAVAVTVTVPAQWASIRGAADRETAAMLAETRPPDHEGVENETRRTLARLCQQVGASTPALRIRETDRLVCLTVRYRRSEPPAMADVSTRGTSMAESAYVVVLSTGLLDALSDRERTAVLAHEVAHRSNWDLPVTNAILAPLYSVSIEGLSWPRNTLAAFQVLLNLLTRVSIGTAAIVFMRGREFAADSAGARLAGDPAALASALETLSELDTRPSADLRAAGLLNLLPAPDSGLIRRNGHPSTRRRIDRLRAMAEG